MALQTAAGTRLAAPPGAGRWQIRPPSRDRCRRAWHARRRRPWVATMSVAVGGDGAPDGPTTSKISELSSHDVTSAGSSKVRTGRRRAREDPH